MKATSLVRLAAALAVLAGCQAPASGPQIEVRDAWARASMRMAGNGAVYMMIHNRGGEPDRLTAASSPAAATVEIHESYADGEVMKMRPVEAIEIPARGTAELRPGGYHVMLIGLTRELRPGQPLPVTLTFEKTGELAVAAQVR